MIQDNDRNEAIQTIRSLINSKKSTIISDVNSAIINSISNKTPSECLEIISRSSGGDVFKRYPFRLNKEYAGVLLDFIRKKQIDGRNLDSGLTDPTCDLVANIFSRHVEEMSDEISGAVIKVIISNDRFVRGISDVIIASSSTPVPRLLQKKLSAVVTKKIGHALLTAVDSSTYATVKLSVMKVAGAAAASPVAMKLAATLITSLATTLKPIIIKMLASTAVKTAIMSKIKAVIMGALLGSFIKIIGAKLGVSLGVAYAFVLAPLIIVWLTHEYKTLPRKLAKSVADSVAKDMAYGFENTAQSLAEMIVERVVIDGVGLISAQFINENNVDDFIEECLAELDVP